MVKELPSGCKGVVTAQGNTEGPNDPVLGFHNADTAPESRSGAVLTTRHTAQPYSLWDSDMSAPGTGYGLSPCSSGEAEHDEGNLLGDLEVFKLDPSNKYKTSLRPHMAMYPLVRVEATSQLLPSVIARREITTARKEEHLRAALKAACPGMKANQNNTCANHALCKAGKSSCVIVGQHCTPGCFLKRYHD